MELVEIFRATKKKRKDNFFEKRGIIPYAWILCELLNDRDVSDILTKSDIKSIRTLIRKIEQNK